MQPPHQPSTVPSVPQPSSYFQGPISNYTSMSKSSISGTKLADKFNTRHLRKRSHEDKKRNVKVHLIRQLDGIHVRMEMEWNERRPNVIVVTPDGGTIDTYTEKPNGESQHVHRYSYNDLDRKFYKQYNHMAQVVNRIKQLTPKITICLGDAACRLMLNGDFRYKFYEAKNETSYRIEEMRRFLLKKERECDERDERDECD